MYFPLPQHVNYFTNPILNQRINNKVLGSVAANDDVANKAHETQMEAVVTKMEATTWDRNGTTKAPDKWRQRQQRTQNREALSWRWWTQCAKWRQREKPCASESETMEEEECESNEGGRRVTREQCDEDEVRRGGGVRRVAMQREADATRTLGQQDGGTTTSAT